MGGINNIYRYTVYRNKDDALLLLDGNIHDCARVTKLKKQTIYKLMCKKNGSNRKWTIVADRIRKKRSGRNS